MPESVTLGPPPAPTRGEWTRIAIAGFLTITVYATALNAGSRTVTAGVACLLVNTGPIFAAVGAMLVLGERLGWRGWPGCSVRSEACGSWLTAWVGSSDGTATPGL